MVSDFRLDITFPPYPFLLPLLFYLLSVLHSSLTSLPPYQRYISHSLTLCLSSLRTCHIHNLISFTSLWRSSSSSYITGYFLLYLPSSPPLHLLPHVLTSFVASCRHSLSLLSSSSCTMEANAGVDMEDYWNEVLTYNRRRSSNSTCQSEEEGRSHDGTCGFTCVLCWAGKEVWSRTRQCERQDPQADAPAETDRRRSSES